MCMVAPAGGAEPPDAEAAIRAHAPGHAQPLPAPKGASARARLAGIADAPMSIMEGAAK